MTRFLNFKSIYPSFKMIALCCCFSISFCLQSQTTADLSRQSIGLSATDSATIRKSFQSIPADNYAYIAIHGDNTGFKILENNNWKSMSGLSLAAWIAVDPSYDGKTIVLLSCNDSTSTQNLATALGDLDRKAKRKLRTIISWDNAVALFENGYIAGYGVCKRFSPASTAGVITAAIPLTILEAPVGNPNGCASYWLESVVLAPPKDPTIVTLCSQSDSLKSIGWTNETLYLMYFNLKRNSVSGKAVFDTLVKDRNLLDAFIWLKQYYPTNKFGNDKDFIVSVQKVQTKYFNTSTFTNMQVDSFKTSFLDFILRGQSVTKNIKTLVTIRVDSFKARILDFVEGELLTQFLKDSLLIGTSELHKNLGVLSSSEYPLAKLIEANQPTPDISQIVLDTLNICLNRSLINNILRVGGARRKIADSVNRIIGRNVNITQLRRITTSTNGLIQEAASWGSIFDHWIEKKMGWLNSKLAFKINGNDHIIDCSYVVANVKVGVEVKHIKGVLDPKSFEQLDINVGLVKSGKINKIEYIFSSQAAAQQQRNKEAFTKKGNFLLTDKGTLFQVYYIDINGNQQITVF